MVDLGCGDGRTLATLDRRLDATSRLVGVDAKESDLAVERAELVTADTAAVLVARCGRRDPDLAPHIAGWFVDLERQARAGEFFYSLNDYAVLLRRPEE